MLQCLLWVQVYSFNSQPWPYKFIPKTNLFMKCKISNEKNKTSIDLKRIKIVKFLNGEKFVSKTLTETSAIELL